MLPERLQAYLASEGLKGADIPKIVAAWEVVKYSTKGALIVASIRYQPLTRLFRRTYRPFRERVRARMLRELERTKEQGSPYARRLRALRARQLQLRGWRETVRANLRRRLMQQRQRVEASAGGSIYRRFADWYREQSEKKSAQVAQSRLFAATAQLLALEPRRLAVGVAEGLILGIVLAPVYYPLEFYLIVRYFQRRNALNGALTELAELRGMVE